MNKFQKTKIIKNRSKLKNALNNWYNWLFKTKDNEAVNWYANLSSHKSRSVEFTVNFKQISHFVVVFTLPTLNKIVPGGKVMNVKVIAYKKVHQTSAGKQIFL